MLIINQSLGVREGELSCWRGQFCGEATLWNSKPGAAKNWKCYLMMIIQDTVVVQDPEMKELVCLPPFILKKIWWKCPRWEKAWRGFWAFGGSAEPAGSIRARDRCARQSGYWDDNDDKNNEDGNKLDQHILPRWRNSWWRCWSEERRWGRRRTRHWSVIRRSSFWRWKRMNRIVDGCSVNIVHLIPSSRLK